VLASENDYIAARKIENKRKKEEERDRKSSERDGIMKEAAQTRKCERTPRGGRKGEGPGNRRKDDKAFSRFKFLPSRGEEDRYPTPLLCGGGSVRNRHVISRVEVVNAMVKVRERLDPESYLITRTFKGKNEENRPIERLS